MDDRRIIACHFLLVKKEGRNIAIIYVLQVYPETTDGDDLILRMNQGSTYEGNVSLRDNVVVIKHGLKISNSTSCYESFVHEEHALEEKFKKIFDSVTIINAG